MAMSTKRISTQDRVESGADARESGTNGKSITFSELLPDIQKLVADAMSIREAVLWSGVSKVDRQLVVERIKRVLALTGYPWNFASDLLLPNDISLRVAVEHRPSIEDNSMIIFADAIASGALVQTHTLDLGWNNIGDEGLKAFADACASGVLENLQELHLCQNKITDVGFATLFPLLEKGGKLAGLTSFGIGSVITGGGVKAFAGVLASGGLAQLTNLELSYHEIDDIGLTALANACANGALPQLTSLHLVNNNIGSVGIAALAACANSAFVHVNRMDLSYNAIGDVGLIALVDACANGAFAHLIYIDIEDNSIGDVGLTAFANACANEALVNITHLDISDNEFGDDGLSALATACENGALANLRFLNINANPIGDDGLSALAAACGNAKLPSLKMLIVEDIDHEALSAVCLERNIKLE